MANVRQTAALGRGALKRGVNGRQFLSIDCDGASPVPATTSSRVKACPDPLLRQGSLELCQRAENMEQKLTLRRGGVHLFGQ